MVDVTSRKCRTAGCSKHSSFGVAGTKIRENCAQHEPDGMINVRNRKYRIEGCVKKALFGVAGTKITEYCAQHAPELMIDAKNRKCRTEGCGKKPPSEVANKRSTEYCAQHARLQCDVEGFREREVNPHYSGKKTIDNVIPSGAKNTTAHPPATKTIQPSGVCWGSRKRVRHPEIAPTASKRGVARESIAGAVTMVDVDGQKSPLKQISYMKTEVQLSL